MRLAAAVSTLLLLGSALAADEAADEKVLKRFFEGHSVVVRLDMPATASGIDVYPEREDPVDYGKLGDRTRASGVAVREGERIVVSRIKLKDDLIEFQLGGGGFNSFKDGSGTATATSVPKSSLEKDLERELKEEKDSRRRREIQRELDDLRHEREAENARKREIAEQTNDRRREHDRRRALEMGSRFNVRFEKKDVPSAFRSPEGVMRALGRYVDFLDLGPGFPESPADLSLERANTPVPLPGPELARTGMTRQQVEAIYGEPLREDEKEEGVLRVRVASYQSGPERIEVTYVDDVAVRIRPLAPR